MSEIPRNRPDDVNDEPLAFRQHIEWLHDEMKQVFVGVLLEKGGNDALTFAYDLEIDFDITYGQLPTEEMIDGLDQFFPGTKAALQERWIPLISEATARCDQEARTIQAAKDRETLRQYETTENFDW